MRSENVPQSDAASAAIAAELGSQTALLERMHAALTREPAERVEDSQTFAFATGAAAAYDFFPSVPAAGAVEVEAWLSGLPGVPFYLLDGSFNAAQAASLIAGAGWLPALFAIPAQGVARVRRPLFSGHLTVCSFGAPTAIALVTVKVRARA